MNLIPREIALRDGRKVILRSPVPQDAAADLRCMRTVFGETEFLLGSPEDVDDDVQAHAARLLAAAEDPYGCLLLCADGSGEIIARLHGFVKPARKLCHRFRLGLCVRRAYWGQGIARAMLATAEETARRLGCLQMELEVMAHNARAIRLYEREGYRIAMVHPGAIRFPDGRMADEYLMMKYL